MIDLVCLSLSSPGLTLIIFCVSVRTLCSNRMGDLGLPLFLLPGVSKMGVGLGVQNGVLLGQ